MVTDSSTYILSDRTSYKIDVFGKTVGMSAEEATDYVRTKQGAIESACWFWKTNNINKYFI